MPIHPLQAALRDVLQPQTGIEEDGDPSYRSGETYGEWRRRVPLCYLSRKERAQRREEIPQEIKKELYPYG